MSLGWILATVLVQELEPLRFDEKAGRITFGAKPGKTDQYPQLKGSIEFGLVMPGGKEYESCFVTAPLDSGQLFEMVKKLGVEPGRPAQESALATGGKVRISVEWKDGAAEKKAPLEKFIVDETGKLGAAPVGWIFQGSKNGYDPSTDSMQLLVKQTRNLLGLYQGEGTPLFTNPLGPLTGHQYKVNKALLPKEVAAFRIVIEAPK